MRATGRLFRRLLSAGALLCGSGASALAAPAMWRVSDADSSIWLFGSVHAFDRPMNWRTAQFDQLLRDADKVYFEMVFDRAAYATITQLTMTAGRLSDGRTLADLLPPADYARLEAVAAAQGQDIATFRYVMPWMAETMLGAATMAELNTTAGVELLLDVEIAPERKAGLETAAEQIGFFSDVPVEQQIEYLMDTVTALEEGTDGFYSESSELFRAWEAGDIAAIQRSVIDAMDGSESSRHRQLLTDRNLRWVPQLVRMLESDEAAMVIVGAAHLVGKDGLPALLDAEGYIVERIDEMPPGGPPGETIGTPLRRR